MQSRKGAKLCCSCGVDFSKPQTQAPASSAKTSSDEKNESEKQNANSTLVKKDSQKKVEFVPEKQNNMNDYFKDMGLDDNGEFQIDEDLKNSRK
mmetsp:Transcript_27152/g.31330  ORF Transcript_27152/g.31330 Transcript_27152/m.31330 type:complete len:94 (-) Transcript_27152:390-671(-)